MSEKLEKVPFEEALSLTGFGKYNVFSTLLCGLLIVAMVFESLSVSFLVPASACELNTTPVQQGLIAGVPLIGIIATSHIWGYFADTKGRRRILRLSLMLGFLGGALSALSPHWIVLCIFKILSASAVSGTLALAYTLLGETTPSDKRNMLILLTTSIYLMSNGLMAVLAIPVLPLKFSFYVPYLGIYLNSWRALCFLYSVPCALGAIIMFCAHESPKYLLGIGQDEKALAVLKAMYASNTGKDPESFQVKSIVLNEDHSNAVYKSVWQSVKAQTLPFTRKPLLKNTIMLTIEFALIYFCINPYIVWLPNIADGLMKSIEKGETGLTFCEMLRSGHSAANQTTSAFEEPKDCALNNLAMIVILVNAVAISSLNLILSGIVNIVGKKRLLIALQIITGVAGLCINASTSIVLTAILFMTYVANCLNFGVLTTFSVNFFPTYLKFAINLTLCFNHSSYYTYSDSHNFCPFQCVWQDDRTLETVWLLRKHHFIVPQITYIKFRFYNLTAMAVCLTLMVGRATAVLGVNILNHMLVNNCELSFYIFAGLTVAGGLLGFFLPADNATAIVETSAEAPVDNLGDKPESKRSPET